MLGKPHGNHIPWLCPAPSIQGGIPSGSSWALQRLLLEVIPETSAPIPGGTQQVQALEKLLHGRGTPWICVEGRGASGEREAAEGNKESPGRKNSGKIWRPDLAPGEVFYSLAAEWGKHRSTDCKEAAFWSHPPPQSSALSPSKQIAFHQKILEAAQMGAGGSCAAPASLGLNTTSSQPQSQRNREKTKLSQILSPPPQCINSGA